MNGILGQTHSVVKREKSVAQKRKKPGSTPTLETWTDLTTEMVRLVGFWRHRRFADAGFSAQGGVEPVNCGT
jgi:hypothetical protein